jgi:cob(I)alamin adenosyltransferase
MKKGYIQVYTGDGKCKTTGALGLVVRAVGAGLRVYFGQFIKGRDYSEIKVLRERFKDVTVEQYGSGRFVRGKPAEEAVAMAQRGLAALREAMRSGRYDVVIADEACTAVGAGLFPEEELLALMADKPEAVELVLTGRGAGARVRDRADLVTEMRCEKHYYEAGVQGRRGIES